MGYLPFVVTDHARTEMVRRDISDETVHAVLADPEQVEPVRPGRVILQSRVWDAGSNRRFLIRVVVDVDSLPCEVVTVFSHEQDRQVLENPVTITYDPKTDTLRLVFRSSPVAESDEDKPGIIIDYDDAGNVVGMEILDASQRVEDPAAVVFRAAV